jgi:hypothetical protein
VINLEEKEVEFSDYSLDDVSCKFTLAEMKKFNPSCPKSYTARTGFAMNLRRRIYDTLNVLYASDVILLTKEDKFVLNP